MCSAANASRRPCGRVARNVGGADAGLPRRAPIASATPRSSHRGHREEGVRICSKLLWFPPTPRSAPRRSTLKFLPGPFRPGSRHARHDEAAARVAQPPRGRPPPYRHHAEHAIAGPDVRGDPYTVYRRSPSIAERVGAVRAPRAGGRSGFMTHAEATKGLKLFAKEVLPRLRELSPWTGPSGCATTVPRGTSVGPWQLAAARSWWGSSWSRRRMSTVLIWRSSAVTAFTWIRRAGTYASKDAVRRGHRGRIATDRFGLLAFMRRIAWDDPSARGRRHRIYECRRPSRPPAEPYRGRGPSPLKRSARPRARSFDQLAGDPLAGFLGHVDCVAPQIAEARARARRRSTSGARAWSISTSVRPARRRAPPPSAAGV